jgi:hypothetical protein
LAQQCNVVHECFQDKDTEARAIGQAFASWVARDDRYSAANVRQPQEYSSGAHAVLVERLGQLFRQDGDGGGQKRTDLVSAGLPKRFAAAVQFVAESLVFATPGVERSPRDAGDVGDLSEAEPPQERVDGA